MCLWPYLDLPSWRARILPLDAFPGKFTDISSQVSFCSFPVSVHLFPHFRCQKFFSDNSSHPRNFLQGNYMLRPVVDALLHQIQCTSPFYSQFCKVLLSPSYLRNGLHFKNKVQMDFSFLVLCLKIVS